MFKRMFQRIEEMLLLNNVENRRKVYVIQIHFLLFISSRAYFNLRNSELYFSRTKKKEMKKN